MLIKSRPVKLTTRTGIEVFRTLPHRNLKMIGPWCFVDLFGPTEQSDAMVVAAHPHTGLQTVTWLLEGEIEHRDSLGTNQVIRPGQLNLMTAGFGISHSELSLATEGNLHAVQMWLALPEAALTNAPAFEHQNQLPQVSLPGGLAKVLAGEFAGIGAPTTTYSPLMAAELRLEPGLHRLPVDSSFEHGILSISGTISIVGEALVQGDLFHFVQGQESLEITVETNATLMLIGGEPFREKILMWWNFIGRSHEDIRLARDQWNARSERFGEFEDQIGGWIPAPDLPNVELRPR